MASPQMRGKQRGVIAAGYIWLVGAIIILFLLWRGIAVYSNYMNDVRDAAKKAGSDECDAAYKARDNTELKAAQDQILALEGAARKAEVGHATELQKANEKLAKEKRDADDRKKQFDADIASGKLVVRRDAFQTGGGTSQGDNGKVGGTASAPGGSDAGTACQLSATARSDLLAVGSDADDTARALALAQTVIIADRKLFSEICGIGK